MRIRKNASKLLGIIQPDASSYPPPRTGQEEEAHRFLIWSSELIGTSQVCELNQSPWDVDDELLFFLPPICFSNSNDSQSSTSKEDKGSVVMLEDYQNKFEKENGNNTTVLASSNDVTGEKNDEKINASRTVKNGRRKSQRKKTESSISVAAAIGQARTPLVCKKTDGKKWKCKRLVSNQQHSFCDHHLDQIRSYHSISIKTNINQIVNTKPVIQAALLPPQKANKPKKREVRSNVKKAGTGNGSNFYYYAGFGPCSTKSRRMTNGTIGEATKIVTIDNKHNSVESSGDLSDQEQPETERKQDAAGKLAEFEQNDGDDHEEDERDCEMGIVLPCNNRTNKGRRRRIKARSLKSLM